MLIPVGDQPNPRGFTPYVNYALLAANVAVFLLVSLPLTGQPADINDPATEQYIRWLMQSGRLTQLPNAYSIFVFQWGYRAAEPSLVTLFSSMFLHAGWMHLLGNMLFLWIYGDNVEHRLGRLGYLAAYLGTGVAATLAYAAILPAGAGQTPLVGASGAISGVLGFYFLWFPRNRVRMFVAFFPFFMDFWLIPARIVLGLYLILDNLLPFLLKARGTGGVAHGAHIGGFIAGLAVAFVLDRLASARQNRSARRSTPEATGPRGTGRRSERGGSTGAPGVMRAYDAGDLGDAATRYLALLPSERRLVAVSTVADLGDWLAKQHQADAALAIYRRALVDHPRGPDRDRLLVGIGRVLLYEHDQPTAAYQYLLDALDAEPRPDVEQAAREALADIARRQKMSFRHRN